MPRPRLAPPAAPASSIAPGVETALTEAAAYLASGRFHEVIAVCRAALHRHPGEARLYECALEAFLALCRTQKSKAEHAQLAEELYKAASARVAREALARIDELIRNVRLTGVTNKTKKKVAEQNRKNDSPRHMPFAKANLEADLVAALQDLSERHELGLRPDELHSRAGKWVDELTAARAKRCSSTTAPAKAPELYRDGKRDPDTGRRHEFVDRFIERVYAPWIVDGVLTFERDELRKIDPECDVAITKWLNNHRGQSLFGMVSRDRTVKPPTPEQVREARRLIRWADRHRAESGQGCITKL